LTLEHGNSLIQHFLERHNLQAGPFPVCLFWDLSYQNRGEDSMRGSKPGVIRLAGQRASRVTKWIGPYVSGVGHVSLFGRRVA
jgi:hypothetical protein